MTNSDWENIKRVPDVTEAEIAEALASRATAKALLDRLAEVSSPDSGSTKVLLVFARMATTLVDWLDGDLCVEFVADGNDTKVQVLTDLGGGLRERVYAPLRFKAPIGEFLRAVERVGQRIAPLSVTQQTETRIELGATAEVRRSSLPPPVRIAQDSFVSDFPKPARVPAGPAPPPPVGLPTVTARGKGAAGAARPRNDSMPVQEELDKGWEE